MQEPPALAEMRLRAKPRDRIMAARSFTKSFELLVATALMSLLPAALGIEFVFETWRTRVERSVMMISLSKAMGPSRNPNLEKLTSLDMWTFSTPVDWMTTQKKSSDRAGKMTCR